MSRLIGWTANASYIAKGCFVKIVLPRWLPSKFINIQDDGDNVVLTFKLNNNVDSLYKNDVSGFIEPNCSPGETSIGGSPSNGNRERTREPDNGWAYK
jgi:hypothetical protein